MSNRLEMRECLGERFESDNWKVTYWGEDVFCVLFKELCIRGKAALVYFSVNGTGGFLVNYEKQDSLNVDFDFYCRYQEIYKSGKYDDDLFLEFLSWDKDKQDVVVIPHSHIEEEFGVEIINALIPRFREFMKIVNE